MKKNPETASGKKRSRPQKNEAAQRDAAGA